MELILGAQCAGVYCIIIRLLAGASTRRYKYQKNTKNLSYTTHPFLAEYPVTQKVSRMYCVLEARLIVDFKIALKTLIYLISVNYAFNLK